MKILGKIKVVEFIYVGNIWLHKPMPREKFNVNRLVYTLYTTKENEYINIKIEGIRKDYSV